MERKLVVSSIMNRTGGALKSAGVLASGSIQTVVDVGTSAKDAVVGLGTSAVELGVSAKDAVTDTADTVVAYASAAASIGVMTAQALAGLGIVVAFVVAPVPTAIGVTIIELLVVCSSSKLARTDEELQARKIARENGRLIDKLARYGTVPATALIETDSASLRLDTVSGTISGTIRTGLFSSRSIEDLSDDDLRSFAASTDAETARLVEAYLKFRLAQIA
ncbi:hypothetical protein G6L37_05930 [Agrobacterium rubi]|nr:hypothetical protein [Agrobacterium rubi]NTF24899.1 hypothetical protein [Agrobacterium rubi]